MNKKSKYTRIDAAETSAGAIERNQLNSSISISDSDKRLAARLLQSNLPDIGGDNVTDIYI
jgi:hypothetical protein